MALETTTTVRVKSGHGISVADGKLPTNPAKNRLLRWIAHSRPEAPPRRLSRPGFRFLGFASLPLVLATLAFAHAVLVESSPSPDSTVKGPDVEITLKFNVRIDVARSRLQLMLPAGKSELLPVREGAAANIMSARATNLTPGKYKLIWQVLASDGHITRGETGFSVQ